MTLPREIKYRGRSIENGEWVYGNLIGTDRIVGDIVEWDDDYFCTEFWVMVDPETVGQLTGLKDRNGVEIYEGDIITQMRTSRPHRKDAKYYEVVMIVEWYDGLAHRTERGLELNPHAVENPSLFNHYPRFIARPVERTKLTSCAWSAFHDCEVIGNAFEHPHLISKEESQ